LLSRKEFIEIIITLSPLESPNATFKESLTLLLEDIRKSKIPYECNHSYRENELWCNDVNDLIRSNLGGIINVLKLYQKPLTFDCIKSIFMKDSYPPIVSKKANLIKAAVLSK
jgi:hypothetical protein